MRLSLHQRPVAKNWGQTDSIVPPLNRRESGFRPPTAMGPAILSESFMPLSPIRVHSQGGRLFTRMWSTVQSFSSAVHPFRRLTDSEVALFFRAEDGKIALPGSAKLSRSYSGVDSKGTYRNGERLYVQSISAYVSPLRTFVSASSLSL